MWTSDEYFSQNPPTKIRKKSRFCKLLKIFLQKNIFIAIKFAYIDIFLYFLLRFFANLTTCNTPNTICVRVAKMARADTEI